jgi:hypothetical protein
MESGKKAIVHLNWAKLQRAPSRERISRLEKRQVDGGPACLDLTQATQVKPMLRIDGYDAVTKSWLGKGRYCRAAASESA